MGIGAILKRIFACHGEMVKHHIPAVEEGIFGNQFAVFHLQSPAIPAEFRGLHGGVGDKGLVTFAQRFDAAKVAVVDLGVAVIPEGGTAGIGHAAIVQGGIVHVQHGITQEKIAVINGRVSLRADSPSAGPSNRQFFTTASSMPYRARS